MGGAYHHPDKQAWPEWVIWMKNHFFHRVCTIVQRMNPTPENIACIRGLLDALEFEYLRKRRVLDEAERIGHE